MLQTGRINSGLVFFPLLGPVEDKIRVNGVVPELSTYQKAAFQKIIIYSKC